MKYALHIKINSLNQTLTPKLALNAATKMIGEGLCKERTPCCTNIEDELSMEFYSFKNLSRPELCNWLVFSEKLDFKSLADCLTLKNRDVVIRFPLIVG